MHLWQLDRIKHKFGARAIGVASNALREGKQLRPIIGLLFVVLLIVGVLQLVNRNAESEVAIGAACGLYERSSPVEAVPLQVNVLLSTIHHHLSE